MTRKRLIPALLLAASLGIAATGCERDMNDLGIAPVDIDPIVFDDDFGEGVIFHPFLDTKLDAVELDSEQKYDGLASLKVTVPGEGDDTGFFSGGAFVASGARDFTGYNALTFWAKASMEATVGVFGLGNDNTGTSKYTAEMANLEVGVNWQKYVIPIPLPAKLGADRGLFFFAAGHIDGQSYSLWIDEVEFEQVDTITDPRPAIVTTGEDEFAYVGQTIVLGGAQTLFNIDGVDRLVSHLTGYFTFASSAESVATVVDNEIRVVGVGEATITAKLGDIDAGGAVTISATAPPMAHAPTPTHPAADVVSLFSNAYESHPVETWSAVWDLADVFDFKIGEDDVKAYTDLGTIANPRYAAVLFPAPTIDAGELTHLHVDVWAPDGFFIKLKLVDFGANGVAGGGDDAPSDEEGFLLSDDIENPGTNGEWVSYDIHLDDFTGLTTRGHLAQFIILGNPTILYLDNIYFYK